MTPSTYKRLPTVIPISDLVEVSMYDQRRPERVRFGAVGGSARGDLTGVTRQTQSSSWARSPGAYKCATRRPCLYALALYAIDDTSRLLDGVPHAAKAGAAVAAPREQIRRDRTRRAGVHDDLMRVPGKPPVPRGVDDEYHPALPEARTVDGAGVGARARGRRSLPCSRR